MVFEEVDAVDVLVLGGSFPIFHLPGSHTPWHQGAFALARVSQDLLAELGLLAPASAVAGGLWNIHGHGQRVGPEWCNMDHIAQNTLSNAMIYQGLQHVDDASSRAALSALNLYLCGLSGDKGLHRHEQALAMQNQQLLLDQQSAGAEQVDALAAKRRLDEFQEMNAKIWSVPSSLYSEENASAGDAVDSDWFFVD